MAVLFGQGRGLVFLARNNCYQSLVRVSYKINQRQLSTDDRKDFGRDHESDKAWLLRFSHENGFLSWSRNAAICAGVGATISMFSGKDASITWNGLSFGFVDLGLVFMTIGSLHHIGSSIFLKKQLNMSTLGQLWTITYTITIWLGYVILIQGNF